MLTLTLGLILIVIFFRVRCFNVYTIFLFLILVLCFRSIKIIHFYIMFELRVIPIFFIIFHQGTQFERFQAAFYLFFYTLTSSVPLLIWILHENNYLTEIWVISELKLFFVNGEGVLSVLAALAFLVKLPLYFLHSWLPKAHVEAPVHGSIVLAGVILKIGVYGLIKISYFYGVYLKKEILIALALTGALLSRISRLHSSDIKILIALSSVRHMSFVARAIIFVMNNSLLRAVIISISHGFVSSNLFYTLNCYYERRKSRRIFMNKTSNFSWRISFIIFILVIRNFSSPPYVRFVGEIFIINLLFNADFLLLATLIIYIIIRTMYSLIFFFSFKSSKNKINNCKEDATVIEWLLIVVMMFPSFLLIFLIQLINY